MGQFVHISSHELRSSVDGLDAGTPARIQTLPEVNLRWIIQNKSSSSLCVVEVKPEYEAFAPRGIAFSSRRGSIRSGRALLTLANTT